MPVPCMLGGALILPNFSIPNGAAPKPQIECRGGTAPFSVFDYDFLRHGLLEFRILIHNSVRIEN